MEAQMYRRGAQSEFIAIQWTGKALSTFDVDHFVGRKLELNGKGRLLVPTVDGIMEASPGDWIVKWVDGFFYIVEDGVFQDQYELCESEKKTRITELPCDDSGPIRKVYEKYAAHLNERLVTGAVMPNELLALVEMYRAIYSFKNAELISSPPFVIQK